MRLPSLLAATVVLCATATLAAPPLPPPLPATVELVSAVIFTLEEAGPIPGRPDLEPVHEGLLLVVRADPALVWPRQVAQPILYAGDSLAARANHGWPEGELVIAVFGTRDLEDLPIWFGSAGLPERVDAESIAAEVELATAAGIGPFTPLAIERALHAGGPPLDLSDVAGLDPFVEALLEKHEASRPGARR